MLIHLFITHILFITHSDFRTKLEEVSVFENIRRRLILPLRFPQMDMREGREFSAITKTSNKPLLTLLTEIAKEEDFEVYLLV